MSKIKATLFGALLLCSLGDLSAAAGGPRNFPAAESIFSASSLAVLRATIAALEIEVPLPPLKGERVIEPGRDLSPKVEDAVRVRAILKLVGDVYNNVHLPYAQDGSVFSNKEGKLPKQPHGFYKEYTLLTGNAPHTVVIGGVAYQVAPDLGARGSERVIIGGGELLYYSPDHYAHFIQLTVVR